MSFKDFDLDIKRAEIDNADSTRAVPSLGQVCTFLSTLIVGSVIQGCSDQCITSDCTLHCPKTTLCTTGQD